MRILLDSHFFHPSVGGVEMMSEGLARAWQSSGHNVHVTTDTPRDGKSELADLEVSRCPSALTRIRLAQWADVFVRSGNSLQSLAWPKLARTPLVTIHHRALSQAHLGKLRSTIEKVTTYLGINVAVSSAVATTIPGPTVCIPNGFRSVFDQPGTGERDGLLFVGRLVQEKGVDTAVRALLCLHDRGLRKHLTVCGEGPYQGRIAEEVQELELEEHVTFKGWTSSSTLADLYRGAEATIIPSRRENFGIVAIEAIASGCPVVATNVGGLPEAVGDCGVLVKPDDPAALADGIETVLDPRTRRSLRKAMPLHVDQHRIDRIAGEYLDLFDSVIQDKSE